MNTFPTFFSHDLRQFFEQWGPNKTELTSDGTKKIKLVPNTKSIQLVNTQKTKIRQSLTLKALGKLVILQTKSTEANKSLKTDANGAHQ